MPQSLTTTQQINGLSRLWQPALFVALFIFEILSISLSVDARVVYQESCTELFCWLAYAGNAVKIVMLTAILSGIVMNRRLWDYLQELLDSQTPRRRIWMGVQLVSFAAFYLLSLQIFQDTGAKARSDLTWIWILTGLACSLFLMLSIASGTFWIALLSRERKSLFVSFIIACLTFTLSTLSADLWHPLSDATFFVSASFLELTGLEVFRVPEERLLGVGRFIVNVAPSCSGYEGIGLITAFTSAYLYFFRSEFVFPRALILFPIGIVCIWIFNAIRIAALIYIGHIWSPEVAIGGFHSQAGWISFIACALGVLWLAHSSNFYTKTNVIDVPNVLSEGITLSSASLIPVLVLLGSNLVIGAISTNFDYLYPVKAILISISILYVWKAIAIYPTKINFEPVLAAFIVCGIWYILVPADPEYNQHFSNSLDQMSRITAVAWLTSRILGAIILIPIAEELGFRGYLLCKIDRKDVTLNKPLTSSVMAIILSSLIFGLLHDAWIAGTAAGLIFALLRIRGGTISVAILAHMLTNAFLFCIAWSQGLWHLL